MLRNLKAQLLVTILLLLSLSLGIMGFWLVNEFRSFYLERAQHSLIQQAQLAEVLARDQFDAAPMQSLAHTVSKAVGTRTTFILPTGQVVGESERDPAHLDNHQNRPEVKEALAGRIGINARHSPTLDVPMLYVAVPSLDARGNIHGVVRLALDLTEINAAFARIRWIALTGGLIALLIGSVLAVANAEGVSEPLREMSQVALRIAKGELECRAEATGPIETRQLAKALNTMADNLQQELNRVQVGAEKLQSVLGSMRDGVILVDRQENIELLNPAAEEIVGFKAEATVGMRDIVLERYPELSSLLRQSRKNGIAAIRRISLGGAPKHIRAGVLPLDSGRTLITLQDLTEVYRAVDIRRDFVANVSHELRTPLTSLGLMVENLLRGALDEREVAEDFLRRMSVEIDRLTRMVLELLQLSRLESDKEQLIKSPVIMTDLVAEVKADMAALLEQRRQTLAFKAASITVLADRAKLKQVLINLIDNASKFSPAGSEIYVGVDETTTAVEAYVRDRGPGIPAEHLPRVYERFFKGSASRGGGTGLGLAIVKHIIEAHGGSVYVESRPGEGAKFGFILQKHKGP